MALKSKIKVRLAECEIKQQDLATQLGVTKQTINGWATGRNVPTLEMSFKIAKLLDCKIEDLFTYIED